MVENPMIREQELSRQERQTLQDFMSQYEQYPSLADILAHFKRKENERERYSGLSSEATQV